MNKAEERYQEIIEILKENPIVTVADFAERLSVSMETIRKDLNILSEQGKIVCVHGGAALAGNTETASPFQFREGVRRREKQKLGKEAVKLIQKGDTLIIESSTTTAEFVKELVKAPELLKTLTIVTNSIHILTLVEMGKLCKRVFLLGGWINEREGATKGQFMAEQLKSFHVDKCILSGAALGKNLILSSYYESDMHFQKLAMESAGETILLLEAGKYPEAAVFSVTAATNFDYMVSNVPFKKEDKERFAAAGLHLIYVPTGSEEATDND